MWTPVKIAFATDNKKSAAFKLAADCRGLGIYVPTIESATVTLEVYTGRSPTDVSNDVLAATADTDWEPLSAAFYTPAGTGDIVVAVAEQPFGGCWLRFVTSNVQTADRTFKVNQHGALSS